MQQFSNISPYIRVGMHLYLEAPWHIGPRTIWDYELVFIKKGNFRVRVEDEIFYAHTGDILFFKPREEHEILLLDTDYCEQPHIHFDMIQDDLSPQIKVCFAKYDHLTEHEKTLFRPDITSSGEMTLPHLIRLKNTSYFENTLYEIIDEFNQKMPFYEMRMKSKLIALLAYLFKQNYKSNNEGVYGNYDELLNMKTYIAANIHRTLTLDELAAKYNMNKRYLLKKFKGAFLITPMHYHKMLRFEKAREMLQYTNKTIDEIATELGFSSAMVFSRAFKDFDGVPPSYYRTR